MGYARDSFYRFRELYDAHNEAGPREISRSKPILANRVASEIEAVLVQFGINNSAYDQLRVSNKLKKQGKFVSPGEVRSIWLRHGLKTFKKRLNALEKLLAQNETMVLTEAQVKALEKAQ